MGGNGHEIHFAHRHFCGRRRRRRGLGRASSSAAQNVDLRIQKEVSQAKVELLNKFISENPKSAASYQQMATDAQKKLDDANQQLNSQQ